jgi:hypothetical protein
MVCRERANDIEQKRAAGIFTAKADQSESSSATEDWQPK